MKGMKFALFACVAAVLGSLWFANNGEATGTKQGGVPEQIEQLRVDFTALQQTVQTQQGEIAGLQQQVSSLQSDNKNLQITVATQQSEITDLKTKVSTLTETLQAQVQSLQADLNTAKENLNTELQKIRTELDQLKVPDTKKYTVKGLTVDFSGELIYQLMMLEASDGTKFWSIYEDHGYKFENVPNGTYQLKFASPYIQSFAPQRTVVVNRADVQNPVIQLSVMAYGVSGTALKADGSPLINVKVMLRDSTGQGWGGDIFTDSNGNFHVFGLPNGNYTLQFGTPTNVIMSKPITINNKNITDLIIQPTPTQTYSVSGKMTDANGNPFFSGIALIDTYGRYFGTNWEKDDKGNGKFVFDNIPNGTYTLKFYYDNYVLESQQQVTVNSANLENLQLKLMSPTFSVSGKAITASGTPLSQQMITLEAPKGIGGYWPDTAEDGTFNLRGIAPGTYKLRVGNPDNPLVTYDLTVTDSDITGIEVRGN